MFKTHHRLAPAAAALSFAAGLAACGGGGSGSGPSGGSTSGEPTMLGISASNYQVLARTAFSSSVYFDMTAGSLVGAEVGPQPQLLKKIVDAVRNGIRLGGPLPMVLTGAAVSTPFSCAGGGSYTVTIDDRNSNNTLDAGDSFGIDYQSCKSETGSVDFGRISAAIDASSGVYLSDSYSVTLSVTTSGFGTLMSWGLSLQGEGAFKVTFSRTPAGVADMTLAIDRFTVTGNSASLRYSTTLLDTRLTQNTRTVNGHLETSNAVFGRVSSSELGNQQVQISTPQPLVQIIGGEAFYSSGQMLVRGAANSALRLTPASDYQVRLELDAGGDGAYEAQVLKHWVDLL